MTAKSYAAIMDQRAEIMRASLSVHEASKRGYAGVSAATSGNYGAAVASQAAKAGLRCIIVQEAFDSDAPSGYLIVDVTGSIRVGDTLSFSLNYAALLRAMTSAYVKKHAYQGGALVEEQ